MWGSASPVPGEPLLHEAVPVTKCSRTKVLTLLSVVIGVAILKVPHDWQVQGAPPGQGPAVDMPAVPTAARVLSSGSLLGSASRFPANSLQLGKVMQPTRVQTSVQPVNAEPHDRQVPSVFAASLMPEVAAHPRMPISVESTDPWMSNRVRPAMRISDLPAVQRIWLKDSDKKIGGFTNPTKKKQVISDWLKAHMASPAAYDAKALLKSFLNEMDKGLMSDNSSLKMIPSYVGIQGKVPLGEPVAVIDAGGTNLRTCIATFRSGGEIELTHYRKQTMPGIEREFSAEEFYNTIADELAPMANDFKTIGFSFSYPATILPDFDARLQSWAKEVKIPELVGQRIGDGLIKALEKRGVHGKRVVVVNDAVAAVQAGLAQGQMFNAASYIGFILGTGSNTAYVENNEKIGKLEAYVSGENQVINVESGAFSALKRGPFDLMLDERSDKPGHNVFEKMLSGVYMGPLAFELLRALAMKGFFSPVGTRTLMTMDQLSTIHINNLVAKNGGDTGVLETEAFSDADREIMNTVFSALVDRAALLTAVNIMAVVVKSGAGEDAFEPVCINIDGSTYYKTHQMAEKVQAHLKSMLQEQGLHARCIKVEDAPVIGAAIAGLTAFQGNPSGMAAASQPRLPSSSWAKGHPGWQTMARLEAAWTKENPGQPRRKSEVAKGINERS